MTRTGILILIAVAALPIGADAQRANKPIREHVIHIEPSVSPVSLDHLIDLSEVVVTGTVRQAVPRDIVQPADEQGREARLPRTDYLVDIAETFKGPSHAQVTVTMIGGDRDRGAYIDRYQPDLAPVLEVGEPYILFLKPSGADRYYTTTATGDSIGHLKGDKIESMRSTRLARELMAFARGELEQKLRTHQGRGRGVR